PTAADARRAWERLHNHGWSHFDVVEKEALTRTDASTLIQSLTWNREPGIIVAVQYRVPGYSKRYRATELKLEAMIRHMSEAPEGWRKRLATKIAIQRQKLLDLNRQLSQQSNVKCWLVGGILGEDVVSGADHNPRS